MLKVVYSQEALDTLASYISSYREYFLEIYSDTGIWSESIIREGFILLSDARHEEIFCAIESRLSQKLVIGITLEKCVTIPWRSKNLYVCFKEHGGTREVIAIEVRKRG